MSKRITSLPELKFDITYSESLPVDIPSIKVMPNDIGEYVFEYYTTTLYDKPDNLIGYFVLPTKNERKKLTENITIELIKYRLIRFLSEIDSLPESFRKPLYSPHFAESVLSMLLSHDYDYNDSDIELSVDDDMPELEIYLNIVLE
jgi:hypothetical protein